MSHILAIASLAVSAPHIVDMETRTHGVTSDIQIVNSDYLAFPKQTSAKRIVSLDYTYQKYGRIRCKVSAHRIYSCHTERGQDINSILSKYMIDVVKMNNGFAEYARDLNRQGAVEVDISTRFSISGSKPGACIPTWCTAVPLPPPPPRKPKL